MTTIEQWLQDPERDYKTGVALYAAHGRNANLLRRFQLRENDYSREKLVYELGKLSGAETPAPAPVEDVPKEEARHEDKHPRPSVAEIKDLYVQRARLHNSLHDFAPGDNEGRRAVGVQIRALTSKITARLAGQTEPEPEKPKGPAMPANALQALEWLNNARSNRSKWRKRMEREQSGTTKHEKAKRQLAHYEQEVLRLEIIVAQYEAK